MSSKLFRSIVLSLALFLASTLFASAIFAAPRLYLDPSSTTVAKDSEFEIQVKIDVESNNAFGADVTLTYPGSDIELKSLTSDGFFPSVSFANDAIGKLEIHAFFPNPYETKSGAGSVAKISFVAKKDSGNGVISFTCSGTGNDTQILDNNGNNILSCGVLNQSNLSFATQGTGGTTPATTPGEPNACGGTCGSNYNCQAEFFCYQGFCRNPACQTDTDCVCPTATPSPKPKITKAATPTPQTVELTEYSPPAAAEEAEKEKAPTDEPQKGRLAGWQVKDIAIGVGVFFLLIVVIVAVKKLIGRRKPPEQTPPTTVSGSVEPPIPGSRPPASPPKTPENH